MCHRKQIKHPKHLQRETFGLYLLIGNLTYTLTDFTAQILFSVIIATGIQTTNREEFDLPIYRNPKTHKNSYKQLSIAGSSKLLTKKCAMKHLNSS